ncbi:hypothetical protein T06_8146 [Trichinella sp. T6]|nr:hypothetical protein T06_8146 [Trichinella sp. T6]
MDCSLDAKRRQYEAMTMIRKRKSQIISPSKANKQKSKQGKAQHQGYHCTASMSGKFGVAPA